MLSASCALPRAWQLLAWPCRWTMGCTSLGDKQMCRTITIEFADPLAHIADMEELCLRFVAASALGQAPGEIRHTRAGMLTRHRSLQGSQNIKCIRRERNCERK